MTLRPIRAFKEINRDLTRLRADEREAEARARVELTQKARTFSRTSRKVVDDTMSLSAVLMRAGEVEEANRLLAEVDREVENEKAALIETVTEAEARKAVAHRKMTRLRLARMLVTAILGSSLMGASAFGVVLARHLAPEPAQGAISDAAGATGNEGALGSRRSHEINYAGVKIALTPKQLAEFERLTAVGDQARLEAFLRKVLSGKLADKIVSGAKGAVDATAAKTQGVLDAAKKTVKESSSSSGSTSSDQEKPKKSSSDEGDNGSGDESSSEEKCNDDDEGGGEQSSFGPVGGCIPVVNEESPV